VGARRSVSGSRRRKGNRLLYIDATNYSELGDPLQFQIESGPVQNFPNRMKVAQADFNFVTGVGVATGRRPVRYASTVGNIVVDDGGITWSSEFARSWRAGDAERRSQFYRTGMTGKQGRRWRLTVSANVYVGFLGGTQSKELAVPQPDWHRDGWGGWRRYRARHCAQHIVPRAGGAANTTQTTIGNNDAGAELNNYKVSSNLWNGLMGGLNFLSGGSGGQSGASGLAKNATSLFSAFA
jgi:hypothetical protein